MPWFSFASLQKKRVAVVLDIGSGSVGAALVVFNAQTPPFIAYTTREDIAHYEHPGFNRFLRAMLNALEMATMRLFEQGFLEWHDGILVRDLTEIHCVLASPWYTNETKILRFEEKKPFRITRSFVDDLVDASTPSSSHNPDVPHYKNESPERKRIEQKIIQILLNGYETDKPYGQEATRIEIGLFSASVAQELGSRMQGVIRKTFGGKKLSFHSFALASFTITRDLFPQIHDFLLLDITGEVTDIFFCKNGILIETCSIPYGKNTMLRDLARRTHQTADEALSHLTLGEKDALTKESAVALADALQSAREAWVSLFETIIASMRATEAAPKQVFLMADSSVGKIFSEWVRDMKESGYEATYLDDHRFETSLAYAKGTPRDFFIGLDALFLNRIL